MTASGSPSIWPDELQPPKPERIKQLLNDFWQRLGALAPLLTQAEYLLANEETAKLRSIVLEMMLALNGIERPPKTQNLNSYLSTEQRFAIEKTMPLPQPNAAAWIGQAVALTVIYRWYAPQLAEKHQLSYPSSLEEQIWAELCEQLPDWPKDLTTDPLR